MPFDNALLKRLTPLIGGLVMLGAVAVILFSGTPVLTEEGIAQRLQAFAARVAQDAARDGREGSFTYDGIDVSGWGYNKTATVRNVSLQFSRKALLETTRWSLSTTRMLVRPDPASPASLLFIFPDPVNVIENSQLKTTISFPSPPVYGYFDGHTGRVHTLRHVLQLPPQLFLTPGRSADASVAEGGRVTVSYDPHPALDLTVLPDSGDRQAEYIFHHVRITSDSGLDLSAALVSNHFNSYPAADGRTKGNYRLQVAGLTMDDGDPAASPPYNLILDLAFTADRPVMLPPSGAPPSVTEMQLKQLGINNSGFNAVAQGTLSVSTDDPLPFGNLKVDIDHVQAFADSALVPPAMRPALLMALRKASGLPAAPPLTHVDLPVTRSKNGVLYVGRFTFEDLAAAMLAEMAIPAAKAPAPVLSHPSSQPQTKSSM